MSDTDFFEVVTNRRCIRRFKPDPVPDEHITKIIDTARWAQSGANAQPWEFIIVKNPETRNKIADMWLAHSKRAWDIEKTRIKELRHNHYLDGPSTKVNFREAPVLIVLCGDPRTTQASVLITHFLHNEGGPMAHFLKNMANVTQIVNLSARALGLGAQWVSVNVVTETPLKALLGVPEELAIHTIVPIGYPAYKPTPTYRREAAEMTHYEKYDRSKYRSGDDIYNFLVSLRLKTRKAYLPTEK